MPRMPGSALLSAYRSLSRHRSHAALAPVAARGRALHRSREARGAPGASATHARRGGAPGNRTHRATAACQALSCPPSHARAAATAHLRRCPGSGGGPGYTAAGPPDCRRPALGGSLDPGTPDAAARPGTDATPLPGAHVSPHLSAPLGLPHAPDLLDPQPLNAVAYRGDGPGHAAGAPPAHGSAGADCGSD